MITERPCWEPAGSGSKCYSAICSNRLNFCPFVHFEQTSHPRSSRCSERRPCEVGTGLAPKGTLSSVLPGPRCILGVAGLGLQPPVLHPVGSVERDEMLRMLTVSGGVCAAQPRGEAALQGGCGFLHETGLVPPKYLWERQQKLLEQ